MPAASMQHSHFNEDIRSYLTLIDGVDVHATKKVLMFSERESYAEQATALSPRIN